jgi:glycerate dehydrogenase
MKIVVLDADPAFGCSAAPDGARGELDVSRLEALGDVTIYDNTEAGQVIERSRGAAILVTNKVTLGFTELPQLPDLKMISVLATGVNVIDVKAASDHGVAVCNVPGYSTMSTAQHTFALLLELCNHVGIHARDVADGGWENSSSFSYFKAPLQELDGKILGLAGLGAIGSRVARMAQAFGMQVLVHTRTQKNAPGVRFVDKATLLQKSDVISLHFPLTDETRHFINEDALRQMKQGALLVNAARGPVLDEDAVARALHEGHLGGLATDVLSEEPPRASCPLLRTPRTIITPHIAWATEASRKRLLAITVDNIEAFLQGTPQNVVTP